MPNLSAKTILLILIVSCLTIHGSSNPSLVNTNCTENSTYNPNSTFRANLDLLFTSLSSSATNLSARKFHNATSGHLSDTVYGLYLCRGDISDAVCHDCVQRASTDILDKCPNKKESVIWYDQCMLRYSNRSIFSLMEETPNARQRSINPVDDPNSFIPVVEDSMTRLVNRTAYNSSGAMFATAETKYNGSESMIYSLAQCTPDLSKSECHQCLKDASSGIASEAFIMAERHFPSCNVRYSTSLFYGVSPVDAPAQSPAATSAPPPPGEEKHPAPLIAAITAPTVVAFLSCGFFLYRLLRRRAKTVEEGTNRGEPQGCITDVSMDMLRFDLERLRAATNDFSDVNQIGRGGFGAVYKGILENGEEVAVKRLSRNSDQGVQEFKSEITLIAKLQHKNLVRLLGFCLEKDEKLLVYEFVPNKSLDFYIFESVHFDE